MAKKTESANQPQGPQPDAEAVQVEEPQQVADEQAPEPARTQQGNVNTETIVLTGSAAGVWVDPETGIEFRQGQPKEVDSEVAQRLLDRQGSRGQLFTQG